METHFECNLQSLKEKRRKIISPKFGKFHGLSYAKSIEMPKKFIEKLEATNKDMIIEYYVKYDVSDFIIEILTKKYCIKLRIPLDETVEISISNIPLDIRAEAREIIKKAIAEAQVYQSISWRVREGLANINKILEFDSLKNIED